MTERKFLYMVRQTQPCCCYEDRTIAIYSDFKKALELSRRLNKEYAKNVIIDKNYDYVRDDGFDYDIHYYDVETIPYNEPFETYGV